MSSIEYQEFKKKYDNFLVKKFWHEFEKKQEDLDLYYTFDFCSLNSTVKADESGQLYLCFTYEKKSNSNENSKLQNIFSEIFTESCNEKYIGFHKFSNNEDFREVMMAIFLNGNELENEDLKKEILNEGNVNYILNEFKKSSLDCDEILNKYIEEIISEFTIVALKVKNAFISSGLLSVHLDITDGPYETIITH